MPEDNVFATPAGSHRLYLADSTPVAEEAGTLADNGAAVPSDAPAVSLDAGREDLTVFFAIGVVIDVVLVAAFLTWAVGQWRRAKK